MSNNENHIALFEAKMREEGLSDAAIKAFGSSYAALVSGQSGMIAEDDITPASAIPYLDNETPDCIRSQIKANHALLKETVVLKLNGGLGTSMGLDKAKSLLTVKGDDKFLDIMAKQVLHLRETYDSNVRFILMNSFSTSTDTMDYLKKYPTLIADPELELMQNKAPKVDAVTLKPAEWSVNPAKEWCPPGHGDLYPSLVGSGKLDRLLASGFKYMFVSNSDNLGATLDMDLLTYFAESNKPFLMECCERTENDKKGGHLATRTSDGQLILRESAQCAPSDEVHFQNITRHQYFNTNNLWVRLDRLKAELEKHGGMIPLPMIKNNKTVDPKEPSSIKVFQLETAMGAAIECFEGAGAVCVPRTRFAPVKKSDDLLMLRSDAYVMTTDFRPVLANSRKGIAPLVSLDSKHYKLVNQLEESMIVSSQVPSLVECSKLCISGHVHFSSDVVFRGHVTIVNTSNEVQTLPSGVYENTQVDLSTQPGLGPLRVTSVTTTPKLGQKPGTSGLRQKTRIFMEGHYLHNFVQSVFNALPRTHVRGGTLVISGDGRYYNPEAIQIIIKMAVAAGVTRLWIGQHGLLSTPAVSAVIRERLNVQDGPNHQPLRAFGGFILSASHNPGGLDEDFGIKYNCENGGPAPEHVTNAIFEHTKSISKLEIALDFPTIDLSTIGTSVIRASDDSRQVTIEVFDAAEDHVTLLEDIFDFPALQTLISRPDFEFRYDSMSGVQGPYARRVFLDKLGAHEKSLINAEPKEDFDGKHADPNLTHATELMALLGVDAQGRAIADTEKDVPDFGAAADGDADRNMILGRRFFVTPSDSLAIIAANATSCIPFFARAGLKGVARSMPTSGALDLVAKKLGLAFFEVPTGWKFFGNLMDSKCVYGKDDYTPFICGEESFGTGSNHIREKDGMWAVLAWLSILAHKNRNTSSSSSLVSVEDIVKEHWAEYGRNYYCRYDYEGVDKSAAQDMMHAMTALTKETASSLISSSDTRTFVLASTDEFTYHDPVDESISRHQGIRFIFEDGSRVIFRLSGTGVAGATIRMYIEKYEAPEGNLFQNPSDALQPLIDIGLRVSKLRERTGRENPTVIT